jgi:peptidylprolyl isomerase
MIQFVAGAVMLGGLTTDVAAQAAPAPSRSPRPAPVRPKSTPATSLSSTETTATTPGGTTASAKTDADVIARVGDSSFTRSDIRTYIASLAPREQAQLEQNPELLGQTVRGLLAGRVVLQQVIAQKWDQQPTVAAQLERVRESTLVELYLQSVSIPPANFPTDEDVQKVYDANRDALLVPRQFELAQIFVAVPKGADKASEENAKRVVEDIQRKLKSGADFAALANDNGAKNGGDLGWVAEPQIRPEIRSQVMGLAKNAMSEPIKFDDGWHIVKLVDTKASYTRTLLEVRSQLVQQIRAGRAAELRRAYIAELLKRTPPTINEIALSKVLGEDNPIKQ